MVLVRSGAGPGHRCLCSLAVVGDAMNARRTDPRAALIPVGGQERKEQYVDSTRTDIRKTFALWRGQQEPAPAVHVNLSVERSKP